MYEGIDTVTNSHDALKLLSQWFIDAVSRHPSVSEEVLLQSLLYDIQYRYPDKYKFFNIPLVQIDGTNRSK